MNLEKLVISGEINTKKHRKSRIYLAISGILQYNIKRDFFEA